MENAYDRIAQQAQKYGKVRNLIHYVNEELLTAEHRRQKSGKAKGTDGIDKEAYEEKLGENIRQLLSDMKTFSYRPLPVRRTYIPKAGSDKFRPLGIPAYRDKLVQGVMRRVLDQIYEKKFYDFSYGFREGKSCHQAISEVNKIIFTGKVNYVADADIKGFFDNIDHKWLVKFLEYDIDDPSFIRYIVRFLKAGIMEDLKYYESDKGTPQGGCISPVCANVYLHYVLDMWFDKVIKSKCRGEAYIVRYADDFVAFFQYEDDAKKYYGSLKERLGKFGLELAEDKSRILPFGRFADKEKIETFDFLGFTHVNAWKNGKYSVKHKTAGKKLKAKRMAVKKWLAENMHTPVSELIKRLNVKLKGHFNYYGLKDNFRGVESFRWYVICSLYHTLGRRSQKHRLNWEYFNIILAANPIVKASAAVGLWK